MATVRWTQEAETWLREIHDYIARNDLNAATNTVAGIFDRTQVLTDYPEIGYRFEAIRDRHVRILLFGHYRIAYLIKSKDEIDILGVFHGALDISGYLF